MHRLVAVLVATCVAGCGLTMTRGPDPSWPADRRPECTESMDAPKRDSFGALGGFLTILLGLLVTEADHEDVGVPLIIGGAVVMAASYASGGIGYFRVKKCRRAIADYEQRVGGPSPAPPPAN